MNLSSTTPVNTASASVSDTPGSVTGNVQALVMKKALSLQAADVAELLASVAQPAAPTVANSGSLGTQLNTFA